MNRTPRSRTALFLVPFIALGFLSIILVTPAAHALTYQSTGSTDGPYTIWWDWAVEGNAVPGQTVYFYFNLYDSSPSGYSVTLTSFSVQTPWATYYDPNLPQVIEVGYSYSNTIPITIPSSVSPGSVPGSLSFAGTYSDGTAFCHSSGNVCTESDTFPIIADPTLLQGQVATLQQSVNTLNGQVTSLTAESSTLSGQISTLQSQLSSMTQKAVQANATIASAKASLATARSNLSAATSQLNSANSQLSSKESELASSQSSLNMSNDVYVPVAAAVPTALAIILAIPHLRKKSVASPTS